MDKAHPNVHLASLISVVVFCVWLLGCAVNAGYDTRIPVQNGERVVVSVLANEIERYHCQGINYAFRCRHAGSRLICTCVLVVRR